MIEKTEYHNQVKAKNKVGVVPYCRQSVADDLEFGSIEAQLLSISHCIKSRCSEGLVELPEKYIDRGASGKNIDRHDLQRLMRDAVAKKFDAVCVYMIDRFSRNLADFVQLIKFFEKHGIRLLSVTQQFDTSTSMGKLTLNILMSFAEFEREVNSERTRDKMGASRREGLWTGGHPVPGYDLVDKKLMVNVVEASQVRVIFKLYLERGSFLSVATELNHRGWTTKSHTARTGRRSGGQSFDKPTVQRVLTSSIYLGKVEYQGQQYEGVHEAIVDEKTWKAVQTLLESHRWDRDWKVRNKWGALLMGLVKCHCGSALTHHYVSKRGKRFHYYVCEKTLKKGAAACPKSRIGMRKLEAAVIEKIRIIGEDPGLLKETAAALKREREERMPELQTEARHLEKEQKQLKEERKELLHTMERDDNGAQGRLERLQVIEERLAKVITRRTEVQGDLEALKTHPEDEKELKTALRAFSPIWAQLFPREKARILNLLIASIVFNGQEQTVEIRLRPGGITALAIEFEEEEVA